jgi:hypothetical protein
MKVDLEKLAKVISAEQKKKPLTMTEAAKIISPIIDASINASQYYVKLLQKEHGFEFVKDERKHLRGKAANNRGETLALQKNEKVETILLAAQSFKVNGLNAKQYHREYGAGSFYGKLNSVITIKLKKNDHSSADCLREFIKRNKIKII